MSYVKLNNTLNKVRVRKDCLDVYVRFMHSGVHNPHYDPPPGHLVVPDHATPHCPRCAGRSFVDLTDAPTEWTLRADTSYNRRSVMECAACHLVMIEDYWDWRGDVFPDGGHQKAVLHLVLPEG